MSEKHLLLLEDVDGVGTTSGCYPDCRRKAALVRFQLLPPHCGPLAQRFVHSALTRSIVGSTPRGPSTTPTCRKWLYERRSDRRARKGLRVRLPSLVPMDKSKSEIIKYEITGQTEEEINDQLNTLEIDLIKKFGNNADAAQEVMNFVSSLRTSIIAKLKSTDDGPTAPDLTN